MVQIIPAVLAKSEDQYQKDITKLNNCESLRDGWVHIDFADNKFVQNQTIEPEVTQKFPTSLRKEAHLMVAHPKQWLEKLAAAGFKRVIFHIECEDDIGKVIDYIKSQGLEVGLALKNDTPVEKIEPFVSKINIVLLMSIVPGFQGQPFIPKALEKIKELKSLAWQVGIGVDGSVKNTNIREIINAGADFVIVGSYLLEDDLEENLENLWEVING